MPELPEVETIKLSLEKHVLNQQIINIEIIRNKIRYEIPDNFSLICTNAKVIKLERRAKYLFIHLNNDYSIIIHLGMSGRLNLYPKYYEARKHDHVIINFPNFKLIYNDPRRFGLIDIYKTKNLATQKYIINLGIEPLDENFNADYLSAKFAKTSKAVKLALMDNHVVVGVGNIYACESLFLAQILPQTPAKNIHYASLSLLASAIKSVLNDAIISGGSTLKDYRNVNGESGYFQHQFKIYGKGKQLCSSCNIGTIMNIKLGGRSSFYCPVCQT